MEEKFLAEQRRKIERRLRYYQAVFATRSPEYRHFKAGTILPQLYLALARIKEKTYGTCMGCGSHIPKKRLRAIPGANRCVRCQQIFELD